MIYRAACAVPLASYFTRSVDGSSILAALDRDMRYSICADSFVNSNGPALMLINTDWVQGNDIQKLTSNCSDSCPGSSPTHCPPQSIPRFWKSPRMIRSGGCNCTWTKHFLQSISIKPFRIGINGKADCSDQGDGC